MTRSSPANPVVVGVIALLVLSALVGCERQYPRCEDDGEIPAPSASPTWQRDVRPIYEARCVRCHREGGPGGFALDSYAGASGWAAPAARAVQTRAMPPFSAAGCCQDLRNDLSLRPEEIGVIAAWAEAGAPEGEVADYVAPVLPDTALPRVDRSLTMAEPYRPTPAEGETDLSRCFLLDWPETEERYVVGLGVRPANAAAVHHAIVLIAGPSVVAGFEAVDGLDGSPGWSCPGGVVWGATGWLGGWSPGWEGQQIPDGLGHRVEPGSKLILSVHYSLVDATAEPDQSTVDLMLADEVSGTLESLSVYDPAWLTGGLVIPKDREDVVHSYASLQTPRSDGTARRLVSANLHMHERGRSGQVGILHPDGSTTCLLQVDRWSYDWQSDYVFADPLELAPDDELFVECHFDNTASNQRVVGGQSEAPRDLNWGEDEEMCVAFVTAAL